MPLDPQQRVAAAERWVFVTDDGADPGDVVCALAELLLDLTERDIIDATKPAGTITLCERDSGKNLRPK
jgi:hypothetical protein